MMNNNRPPFEFEGKRRQIMYTWYKDEPYLIKERNLDVRIDPDGIKINKDGVEYSYSGNFLEAYRYSKETACDEIIMMGNVFFEKKDDIEVEESHLVFTEYALYECSQGDIEEVIGKLSKMKVYFIKK